MMDAQDDQDPLDLSAGDAACWSGLLCPECGAVPEGDRARDPSAPCWRCGTVPAEHRAEGS
ncbi:hypothetical protein H3H54_15865 [Brachybacterium sp. Z12]|uniref:hypothetical protein n=2 Tax=Brachybacterium TaxID=43668 RepID=UPI00186111EA|nr:hypothetical protein [Brachybacterium sp. Z12]QNN82442.1 hypothetical protein H3H54_15865 [Brachybacterium sp. Z12]